MRMDGRFKAAMVRAGETPTMVPDRVAVSLLPRRVP
jgi:hypothetical protein